MLFHIQTTPPLGRNTWEPDLGAKVQNGLFAIAAVMAAASSDAEAKLLGAVESAKAGRLVLPTA